MLRWISAGLRFPALGLGASLLGLCLGLGSSLLGLCFGFWACGVPP